MIDLILIVWSVAVFGLAFWCGTHFGSYSAMWGAVKARVKTWTEDSK